MAIERLDFENINEADLNELLAAQVPEGLRIEYKRELYGNTDGDKKEFLKDVSAFANAQGGHLIIGIEENGGIPTSINGIPLADVDEALLRLDQIIQNGLEPRIRDVRTKNVVLANGSQCIIIRIPRSWNPPHRVIAGNSNRFYIRNERNVGEPNVQELRTLFTKGQNIIEAARQFRGERLATIISGQGPRPLVNGGRLITHIIPFAALTSDFQVNLESIHTARNNFSPLGAVGIAPRYNFDGYIIERTGEENHGYTQIFRNGIIEATKAPITRTTQHDRLVIPGIGTEGHIFKCLHDYMAGLQAANVPPPFIISFVLEGVLGAAYAVNADTFADPEPPIDKDILYLPECYIENYGATIDYHKAVKPAFDALWNASEFSSAQSFNNEGLWVGQQRRR